MQKQGLGGTLAAVIEVHCSLKKLILLRSGCLIHVTGNDSGHKQSDSLCPHFRFSFSSVPVSFPDMLWLWKAECDTIRDLHLLCTNTVWVAATEQKLPLGHTLGLPTREDYFWIKALAHCQLQQNSHWSQQSQDFMSVAAILTSWLFCLGTSSTKRVLPVPEAFVLWTAGRSPETVHINNQILISHL